MLGWDKKNIRSIANQTLNTKRQNSTNLVEGGWGASLKSELRRTAMLINTVELSLFKTEAILLSQLVELQTLLTPPLFAL